MSEFNVSLLREKFVIHDALPASGEDRKPVVAMSNRLALPLQSDDGKTHENFIVRAQNMHACARYAAHIARDFQENGEIMGRATPFDWTEALESLSKGYEEKWNPNLWVAVYHKGRIVFEGGPGHRHPFLDIIEQCDARNKDDYNKSMTVAQDAFRQAGKIVNIEYDSNIALIMSVTADEGKCGVIVRGPSRTTTFNFTARRKQGRVVRPSQCLTAAAAFLEGIQLCFLAGMTSQKVRYELIASTSDEARKGEEARKKIGRLNAAILQFESLLDVHYRPDRPDFGKMIDEAEEFAQKNLAAEIERMVKSGQKDPGEWVL